MELSTLQAFFLSYARDLNNAGTEHSQIATHLTQLFLDIKLGIALTTNSTRVILSADSS